MENDFIETGKVVNTHGKRGEVKLQPWADSPGFLTGFEKLYIDGKPIKMLSARVHKGCVIATLEGVDDIDAAIKMKNKIVSVKREDVQLEEGRYFIADLVGLCALNAETGEKLGTITDVLTLPANNVYVIKGERDCVENRAREILVPAVPEFIIETNVNEGYVRFRLIDGL
jgi:16S rRNA processing protein RimM